MADPHDARLDAAAGVRSLAHSLTAHEADEAALADIRDFTARMVERLQATPRRERIIPAFGDGVVLTPDPKRRHPMDDRGVAGPANPTAVELEARREGDEVIADVCFGAAFEGAPGRVHGGMVAAVFDDLLGYVLAMVGEPGFTGQLTVTYRAPVPTERPVEFRARFRARERRKLYAVADAHLGDTVLATAEATFILVAPEKWSKHARELLGD